MPPLQKNGRLFSPLEYAPSFIVYALHVPYGIWLALRHRSTTLPAIANPSILVGGIAGESKTDMSLLVGPFARKYFAPFVTVSASASRKEIRERLRDAGLSFPLVAKPDIGRYFSGFPAKARMVIQRYITDEGEAGVFYVRKPSETRGRISSLTLKYFPRVTGDGRSTLRQLILKDPRAARIARIYFRRNKRNLDRVIPAGEEYRLVSVGNHVRGSLFTDGAAYITDEMTETFDRISKDIRDFYFGRFDIRFADLKDLQNGAGFTILEYNGASSEPTHVWDRRTGILATYRDLLKHWRFAFEVGAEHRANGIKTPRFFDIIKIQRAESRLIRQYPDEE